MDIDEEIILEGKRKKVGVGNNGSKSGEKGEGSNPLRTPMFK